MSKKQAKCLLLDVQNGKFLRVQNGFHCIIPASTPGFLGCFGPQDPIEIKGAPFFPPPKEELTKMQGANMNTIDFSSQKKERLEKLWLFVSSFKNNLKTRGATFKSKLLFRVSPKALQNKKKYSQKNPVASPEGETLLVAGNNLPVA